jgi:hypothetical protein
MNYPFFITLFVSGMSAPLMLFAVWSAVTAVRKGISVGSDYTS